MKVFDLRCRHGHRFEGWFASDADFAEQRERGLLCCPVCDDAAVTRLPSAPRLNLGSGEASDAPQGQGPVPARTTDGAQPAPQEAAARAVAALRELLARTEDVGERFAAEARRMHYGEVAERNIRGRASAEDARALLEEGVPVLPLPLPEGFDGPLH
ncbi:DUF1178 family protein [Tibeticola sp.]|uniref:DUF1178 family protein n=1 Tax=Tibeticola sp. TaxID=2005368 RepID=UPI0025EDE981|nr:DUF1178 family protein [Tibeticola sp.]